VSRGIGADTRSIVGADLSPNMIEVYKEKAAAAGIADKISTVTVDILAEGSNALEGKTFDAITVRLFFVNSLLH
jgi:ubiquinone/menaquinone biosynthesis C-methylase UbiE